MSYKTKNMKEAMQMQKDGVPLLGYIPPNKKGGTGEEWEFVGKTAKDAKPAEKGAELPAHQGGSDPADDPATPAPKPSKKAGAKKPGKKSGKKPGK